MFIGEYNHTLDAKGRLIVPSKLRESLGERFFLTKGLDGCLSVYPQEEWETFTNKIHELPMTNKDARKFSRFFLAGASECEIDKQGRILIPANLREFAKLEKEAVLVGVSNRIEIWNRDKWEEINVLTEKILCLAQQDILEYVLSEARIFSFYKMGNIREVSNIYSVKREGNK